VATNVAICGRVGPIKAEEIRCGRIELRFAPPKEIVLTDLASQVDSRDVHLLRRIVAEESHAMAECAGVAGVYSVVTSSFTGCTKWGDLPEALSSLAFLSASFFWLNSNRATRLSD
jgi:hypothetical protein